MEQVKVWVLIILFQERCHAESSFRLGWCESHKYRMYYSYHTYTHVKFIHEKNNKTFKHNAISYIKYGDREICRKLLSFKDVIQDMMIIDEQNADVDRWKHGKDTWKKTKNKQTRIPVIIIIIKKSHKSTTE